MGINGIWYERVSPRLLDFILGSLSESVELTRGKAYEIGRPVLLDEAAVDGLPEGAVFTIEQTAEILKLSVDAMERMVRDKHIRTLRFGDETRIPRRALFACLRGMTADEFDDFLARRACS